MKLVDEKGKIVVIYNREKEKNLTWRKVKEFCKQKLNEIDNSKERDEIVAINTTIMILQHKVDLFNKKRDLYRRMYDSIKDSDTDLDIPFVKEENE